MVLQEFCFSPRRTPTDEVLLDVPLQLATEESIQNHPLPRSPSVVRGLQPLLPSTPPVVVDVVFVATPRAHPNPLEAPLVPTLYLDPLSSESSLLLRRR